MESGVHVFAAAGNDGQDAVTTSPRAEDLNKVGALDADDTVAKFSAIGTSVIFWAPGVGVMVLRAPGAFGVALVFGTCEPPRGT